METFPSSPVEFSPAEWSRHASKRVWLQWKVCWTAMAMHRIVHVKLFGKLYFLDIVLWEIVSDTGNIRKSSSGSHHLLAVFVHSWVGTFGSSCWCIVYLCGCNLHQQNIIMVKMLWSLVDTVGCLMASHDTDAHNNISLLSCRLAYKRYAWRTYCKGLLLLSGTFTCALYAPDVVSLHLLHFILILPR